MSEEVNLTLISTGPLVMCPPLRLTPLIISAGLVSCGIIVGNTLVIIAIVGGNSKFFRPMYWFIIHLSVSDLSIGFMLLWNYCLAGIFDVYNTLTSLSILQAVWVTTACSSVLGILLLAVDRYMQVVHRRLHTTYFNQRTVGAAILFAWIIPLFVFLIAPITFNWSCKNNCTCHLDDRYIECMPFSDCSQVIPPFTKSYILGVSMYLLFIMPWPILIYSLIFIKAKRKSSQVLTHGMRHRDIRLIRTLVVIMLAFIVTLTPACVVMLLDYFTDTHNTRLTDYALYSFVVGTVNSLLNPILYIWRIPAIRLSLEQRLPCCRKPNVNGRPGTSATGNRLHARFYSEQALHSDAPASPLNPKTGVFVYCGRQLNSVASDCSQTSTPLSQRSLKRPPKMSKTKRMRMFEMQRISSDHPTLTPSPLCGDVTEGDAACSKPVARPHGGSPGRDRLHSDCSDEEET